MMFSLTRYAISLLIGFSFNDPAEVTDYLLPHMDRYVRQTLGITDLRPTFIRNALQPVDLAAYVLYAKCSGICSFRELIPKEARQALSAVNPKLACIPLITYAADGDAIRRIIDDGEILLKIKLGHNPSEGDKHMMLEWDKQRLTQIYSLTRETETSYTSDGHILFYLDANGCYPSYELLEELLEHADRIGILPYILLLEEPFPEESEYDVRGLPVRIAADESVYDLNEAVRRMEMGYRAIALKPIVKTLTESFRIAAAADTRDIPCFCADLTVNPFILEWNKHFAACLHPMPSMKIGVLESNGHQNYARWDYMEASRLADGGRLSGYRDGVYNTEGDFTDDYSIFRDYTYYTQMFTY
jgi:L-alanine-DL-glutamate epimerase-like enolase superfamily enzyme